jgi:hypothetical protein
MRTAGNTNLAGWNGQAAIFANKWFGGVVDLAGNYQTKDSTTLRPKAAIYSILGGPRLVDRAGRVSGFAHFLIGVSHVGQGIQMKGGPTSGSSNNLTTVAGGGVDVDVSEKVAVRVFQAEWERIRLKNPVSFNLQGSNAFRLSIGLVFKAR